MQAAQQFVVLFERLGETETGIDDDAANPPLAQMCRPFAEIVHHLRHDVAVVGHRLHRAGVALHVHGHVGHVVLGRHVDDKRIQLAGRNIVDDHLAVFMDRPRGHARTERIDRNRQIGRERPHGPDTQIDAPPLLLGRHLVGTRAR